MTDYYYEAKRRMAREHIENKLRFTGHDRDEHLNAIERLRRKDLRKRIAKRVSEVVKQHSRDELRVLAELAHVNATVSMTGEWFRNYMTRKYGDSFVERVTTWKSHWERPIWSDEGWYLDSWIRRVHLTHVSEDDPTQIAYNRTIDNVKRDIQTRTKPGKYLQQFFGDVLSPSDIKYWAERQIAHASCAAELKFIENDNPDGWDQVYEDGPHSCMAGKSAVQVYAYPGNGLRLAYLESDANVVARSIVRDSDNPDYHGFVRIYSTEQRWDTKLRALLEAAGYGKQINLHKVKLTRINANHDYNEGVVCPYIDCGSGGNQTVSIHDDYIMIDNNGDICATNTGGTIPLESGRECDDCGEREDEDDGTYVESVERWVCNSCLESNYTYAHGRRYQDWYPNDDCVYCESDGEHYHAEYAANHDVYQCEHSGDWYNIEDLLTPDIGEYAGQMIHVDEVVRDHISDELVYCGDATQINGEWVAEDYVAQCHITGDQIDIRESVCIQVGYINTRSRYAYKDVPAHYKPSYIYVGADSFNLELIREQFVRCGDLLLPRGYYGNDITDGFVPANIDYGDDYAGDSFADLFVEELAEAA